MAGTEDWGSVQIGRLTLREGFTLTSALNGTTGDRSLSLAGEESSPPLTVAEVQRLQEDILGLQDRFLPFIFTHKDDHNGWYQITDVDTSVTNWTGEVVKFSWTVSAVRVGAENGVDVESRLTGVARQNPFSLAGERWHAPSATAWGYYTGTSQPSGSQDRVLADSEGTITVYRGVPASVSPRWGVALADYNRGRARVLVDDVERVATNITMGASAWELNNGLVRVLPGSTTTLQVSAWDSGSTVLATDTFTGSDGAAISATWTNGTTPASGGGVTIQANAARFVTGTAPGTYQGANRISRRVNITAPVNGVALFSFRYPGATRPYLRYYVRSTNTSIDAQGGYWIEINPDLGVWLIGYGVGYANTSLPTTTTADRVSNSWVTGVKYWVRFGVVDDQVKARVWQDGSPEPDTWTREATDTTHTGANSGTGLTIPAGGTSGGNEQIDVDDFSLSSVFPGSVGTWDPITWNASISGSASGPLLTWDAATVLRNDHELVTVRLVGNTDPGRVSLDLTLRRGSRFVETYLQTDVAGTKSWYRDSATAGTAPASGAYIAATADDAQGNRYFIAAANSFTAQTTQGGITRAATRTLDAGIGAVVAGASAAAGDAATVLRDQYIRAMAEQTMGVRR